MAYSELIKDFSRIRDYMREFFVYGFKSRNEYAQKSPRSYDNERRRIESWLSDYMSFRQDISGKNMFISVDSRHVPHNPLYKAWKAASFTKNDISLHFFLLDILSSSQAKAISDIVDIIDREYMPVFSDADPIDESTLRKKIKEYVDLGLIIADKRGKQLVYLLSEDTLSYETWLEALLFFSEENPLGVVGSFLLDKLGPQQEIFSYKHHYLLFTLDSGILLNLLSAIQECRKVEIELFGRQGKHSRRTVILPMKIFISTQGGRQYLAGVSMHLQRLIFFRLDVIHKVKLKDRVQAVDTYKKYLNKKQAHIWGVATGNGQMEHIEMTLDIAPGDNYILRRLEREKRCGTITQVDETKWLFTADVYDAQELLPWLRTFIGRIKSLNCSNKVVEARFWSDFAALIEMYEGDGNVV